MSGRATLKSSQKNEESPGFLFRILRAPFYVFFAVLLKSFSIIRPYTPRLIPLVVCTLFIPLIVTISLGAGWYVWSSLSASWEVPLYLQYGDGVPPYAYAHLPGLMTQQRYAVSVDLTMPATEANLALGNFMTSVTFSTLSNTTLAYVRRPVRTMAPPPKSGWVFGKSAIINVKLPLLDSFITSTSSVAASIEIGRRDGWKSLGNGEGREVSVLAASIRGLAVPHGVRGLAIRFPLLSSLATAAIFFTILSVILGLCLLPMVLGEIEESSIQEASPKEVPIKPERKRRDSSLSQLSLDEGSRRRRRRSRSSRSLAESPVSLS
ncbi:putative adipose-regulatory protein-domain-containing protein [Crepidotus variabilis]|uniref:Adipose-regulatory protein-domain-containing protein n=1 Tax=Crepidotus variabilis TaxID=179855 RepID=A0A9P6JNV7_9AGAR|nr:putative adipose-regulatory protein-domain-containing protein [Crepidotus variabilis]